MITLSSIAALRGGGSAMNDTVQQTGAALSVAVLGSVLAAKYTASLPDAVPEAARHSIADTLALGPAFVAAARDAFTDAMSIAMVAGTAGAAAGAIVALVVLPRHRVVAEDERPRWRLRSADRLRMSLVQGAGWCRPDRRGKDGRSTAARWPGAAKVRHKGR